MASLSPLRTANLLHRLYGFFVLGLLMLLAACGGPNSSTPGAGSNTGTSTGSTAQPPSLTLTLSSTSISPSQSGTATAVVHDGAGNPVAGTVVTFSTTGGFATFSPTSGAVLTDKTGTANITIQAGTASGAAFLTASAPVAASATTLAGTATAQLGYQVSATQTAISLSSISIGSNPLSAYGTTSVTVTVNGTTGSTTAPYAPPLVVNFSSPCAANGKATLSSSVTTVNGIATAQYVDNGCNSTDPITATISNLAGVQQTAQLVVKAPSDGSIQFVSANPQTLTLAGTGGANSSIVVFKVLDQGGNPIKANVNFTLNTQVGGVQITSPTAISDPTTGLAQTIVNAGTVPTPVRVTATIAGTNLSTQSSLLSISTGLPDQAHFSTSANVRNIEGLTIDGVTSTISVQLADHFGNPVPDNTAVNFVASGGSITPLCTTTKGACSVTLTSSNPRPSNGRVAVLAYAIGESCFTDLNGNGLYDGPSELVDVNGLTCDLPEAFLDLNETGVYISTNDVSASGPFGSQYAGYQPDPFVDFNTNSVAGAGDTFLTEYASCNAAAQAAGYCSTVTSSVYAADRGDGLYHGSLCSKAAEAANYCCTLQTLAAGTCQISNYRPSINVRSQTTVKDPTTGITTFRPFTIVFGGSKAMIEVVGKSGTVYASGARVWSTQYQQYLPQNNSSLAILPLPFCGSSELVKVYLSDVNYNVMPKGTQVTIASAKGSIQGTTSYTLPDSIGRALPTTLPSSGQALVDNNLYLGSFWINDDGSFSPTSGTCTPSGNAGGVLSVTVTSPTGKVVSTNSFFVGNPGAVPP